MIWLATLVIISGGIITLESAFAQTFTITPTDNIAHDSTLEIDAPREITMFRIGSSTYVAVTANAGDGVQILDVTNPSSITSAGSITNSNQLKIDNPQGITSFKINSSTYVAVAGSLSDSVQILDVANPSSITGVSNIDDMDGNYELDGPKEITSFKIGSSTYVAVTAENDNGVQILDVSTPSSITAVGNINDSDGNYQLSRATGITSFKIGSSTYVAVTARNDNGVQILDVSTPSSITATDSITDTASLELSSPHGVTSFKINSSTYVAVAAGSDDGVQIIDVTDPSDITAVGNIDDNDSLELDGARDITSFKFNSGTYLAVTGNADNGIQILDVSNPSNITPVVSINNGGGAILNDPWGIISFEINSKIHFAVAAHDNLVVQILKLNQPPTANAGEDQTVASGNIITLKGSGTDPDGDPLRYSWEHTSGPAVTLTNSTTQQPTFTSPNGPATITFTLSVSDGTDTITDTVDITIKSPQAPTANAGRDRTFPPDSTATLSGSGTDPDGNTLTYSWSQDSGTSITLDDSTSAHTTFTTPEEPEKLVFTLTVSDDTFQDTDSVTITVANITRNIKEIDDIIVSAQITAPNQITMMYNEELSTFINSYLNFTITGETTSRNIIGINGSPSKSMVVNIDGYDTNVFVTILTFDGKSVPSNSTGTMYMQHTNYYLKFIQVSDGQD